MADDEKDASESSSVRDDLLAAIKEHEEPDETSAPATEVAQAERTRDEAGRFAKTGDAGSATPVQDPEPRSAPVQAESRAEPAKAAPAASGLVDPQVAAAPSSWGPAVQSKWTTLDPEVRSTILKREQDIHRQFTTNDQERNFGREIRQIVAPYEALIRADGGTVPHAIASVLNTAYILRTGDPATKARAIREVCQQYGVDLKQLGEASTQANPEVEQLRAQLQQLQAQWTQKQQTELQQMESQVLNAVETFRQDPKHPHFQAVSAHMGALMQAGEAKDMEQAYEMAVWARPDLRAQLLSAQQDQQRQAEDARKKTERARAKGVSVRGGPGGTVPQAPNPNASVRETLMAAMAEVNGRV